MRGWTPERTRDIPEVESLLVRLRTDESRFRFSRAPRELGRLEAVAGRLVSRLREVGGEDVTVSVSESGADETTRRIDEVGDAAGRVDGRRSTVRVGETGSRGTRENLDEVDDAADRLDGRNVTLAVGGAAGLAALGAGMTAAAERADLLQSTLDGLGAHSMPLAITRFAGIAGAAASAASAAGSLAVELGKGAAGLAAIGGVAGGAAYAGLKGYVSLLSSTASASREAYFAMNEGAQEALDLQKNQILATEASADFNQELNDSVLGFARLQAAVGEQAFPRFTEELENWNGLLRSFTPEIAATSGELAGMGAEFSEFVRTAGGGRVLRDVFSFVSESALKGASVLSSFGKTGVRVLHSLLAPADRLGDSVVGVAESVERWSESAEGARTLDAVVAGLERRMYDFLGIVGDVGAGALNIFSALEESGAGDALLGDVKELAQGFSGVAREGSESRETLMRWASEGVPILRAAGGVVSELWSQFARVADAAMRVRSEGSKTSALVAILNSVRDAAEPVAGVFADTFEVIGPKLPRLIDNLAGLFETFAGQTPVLALYLDTLNSLLETFNSLPQPVKNFVANAAAIGAISSTGPGGGVLGLAGALGQVYFQFLILRHLGITTIFTSLAAKISAAAAATWGFAAAQTAAGWAGLKAGVLSASAALRGYAASAWAATASGRALMLSVAPLLAIGAIAIDFVVHAPDIAAAFRKTYGESRAAGKNVASSFLNAAAEGLKATVLGSTVDRYVTGPLVGAIERLPEGAVRRWINRTFGTDFRDFDLKRSIGHLFSREKWRRVLTDDGGLSGVMKGLFSAAKWREAVGDSEGVSGVIRRWWSRVKAGAKDKQGLSWLWKGDLSGQLQDQEGASGVIRRWWSGVKAKASDEKGLSFLWSGGPKTPDSEGVAARFRRWWDGVKARASDDKGISFLWSGGEGGVAGQLGRLGARVGAKFAQIRDDASARMAEARDLVAERVGELKDRVIERIAELADGARQRWDSFWTGMGDRYERWRDWALSSFSAFGDGAQERFASLGTGVADRWDSFWTGMGDRWERWRDWALGSISGWGDEAQRRFSSFGSGTREWWDGLWVGMGDRWERWRNWNVGDMGAWANSAQEKFSSFGDGLRGKWDELWVSMGDRWERWSDWFGADARAFLDGFDSLFAEKFGGIADTMAEHILDGINKVRSFLGDLMGAVARVLGVIGMDDIAGRAMSAHDKLKTPIQMAKGGVVSGDNGALGDGSRIVAITNEAGPEAVIPLSRRTAEGQRAWRAAAASPNAPRPHRTGREEHSRRYSSKQPRMMAAGGIWGQWTPEVAGVAQEISSKFGVTPTTYAGHGRHGDSRTSIDFAVAPWGTTAAGPDKSRGDAIADHLQSNWDRFSTEYLIWFRNMKESASGPWFEYSGGGGYAAPSDPSSRHEDHVHYSSTQTWGGPESLTGAGGPAAVPTLPAWAEKIVEAKQKFFEFLLPDLPSTGMGMLGEGMVRLGMDAISDVTDFVFGKIRDWAMAKWATFSGGGSGGAGNDDAPVLNRANQAMAREMAADRGWTGSQWTALDWIWRNESGFDHLADNPTSDAYGIPQAMTSAHDMPAGYGPPGGDPEVQIRWGLDYIAGRYGDPVAAKSAWQAQGWYRRGGIIPGRKGEPVLIQAHSGERVLPENAVGAMDRLASSLVVWSATTSPHSPGDARAVERAASREQSAVEKRLERIEALLAKGIGVDIRNGDELANMAIEAQDSPAGVERHARRNAREYGRELARGGA